MSTVTFEVGKSMWISANDRLHWADEARRTRELRQLGRMVTVEPQETTHVAAFIGYPRNSKADPSNAAPTVKALIDGMVDAGVWPDDDHVHVIGPTYLRDVKSEPGMHTVRLVLTAQEVPW